jgi:hypothetical protein
MRKMIALFSAACCTMLVASVGAEDNPGYTSWAKFKPGTSTTMTMTSDAGGQSSKTETKTTLTEVKPDKVVLSVVMSMEAGGQKMDMPAQSMEIPKTIETPKAPDGATAAATDAAKANSKTSEETVKVGGGEYKAKVTESTVEAGGSKTVSKVWMSDEVPGGMIKMEATTDGPMKSVTKSELKAFDKK